MHCLASVAVGGVYTALRPSHVAAGIEEDTLTTQVTRHTKISKSTLKTAWE